MRHGVVEVRPNCCSRWTHTYMYCHSWLLLLLSLRSFVGVLQFPLPLRVVKTTLKHKEESLIKEQYVNVDFGCDDEYSFTLRLQHETVDDTALLSAPLTTSLHRSIPWQI